tara:strand:+ start:2246 stop:3082 length:837 start_codon:yes stop_codon:yes gene_type:complete
MSNGGRFDYVGNITSSGSGRVMDFSGVAYLTLVGNVTCSNTGNGIRWNSTRTLEVTGSIANSGSGYGILTTTGAGAILLTGAISTGGGIQTATASNVTVTGNVTGDSIPGIDSSGANTINVIGTMTAGSGTTGHAVASINANSTVYARGNILNTGSISAMFARRVFVGAPTATGGTGIVSSVRMYNDAAPNVAYVYNYDVTGEVLVLPEEFDVRLGTSYGYTSEFTGTLVQTPDLPSVAAAVWNYATSSATTSGSIGERLKNAATVATTGAQIAGFGE